MQPSPSPTEEPDACRTLLFSLVGDDDPYDVQQQTPAVVRALVTAAGGGLRVRPEPGEWSGLEVIGHIVDAEIVYTTRYRWILAHDEPELLGYDQDLWVQRLGHNDGDVDDLLAPYEALRTANLALWKRTPEELRSRAGRHLERGPETYGESFRLVAGHDRFHVRQLRATIDQVAGATRGATSS